MTCDFFIALQDSLFIGFRETHLMIANYEWPFFLVCGILFFSAFAISVTGFGIILYKKFQKTNRHDKSVEKADKSGSDRYMFILAIVSCFLILTDVCLFISNNRLSEDLPRARETLISSVDDLQNFQNSTVQELDHILRDDFDREVGGSLNQFRGTDYHNQTSFLCIKALADCSTSGLHSILTKRQVHFNKASESALSALYKTRDMLSRINMTLGALHEISTGLRSELGKMNLYFKEAKRLCSSSQQIISEDICKKFVNEKDLFSRQLPQEILKSQEDIERTLCEERSGKLKGNEFPLQVPDHSRPQAHGRTEPFEHERGDEDGSR
ncbi:prominin-1-A-like isoform X3 [Paramuricea clavata]|uniref:Prominin-1-A-like isoform X3 n=1 Tax=Paramuricea clavata TaxID=317549 RepID=A0A6S7FRF8_PARCT|nr:prominin-1-A-like isoform X3 [Paramuricea clavata]